MALARLSAANCSLEVFGTNEGRIVIESFMAHCGPLQSGLKKKISLADHLAASRPPPPPPFAFGVWGPGERLGAMHGDDACFQAVMDFFAAKDQDTGSTNSNVQQRHGNAGKDSTAAISGDFTTAVAPSLEKRLGEFEERLELMMSGKTSQTQLECKIGELEKVMHQ